MKDVRQCPACGKEIVADDLYCRHCGHRQLPHEGIAPVFSGVSAHVEKKRLPERYPPLEGTYMRGNDYSPVAVAIILTTPPEDIAPSMKAMVTMGLEAGAALSGTIQTENIGMEKMLANLVANPNIRYLVIGGPESPGHSTANAIICLKNNGVDEKRFIIGSQAPTPYLYNLPEGFITRFRQQITLIDLVNEGDPDLVRQAVRACIQEEPVDFRGLSLWDCGAFPGEPLVEEFAWRVAQPWYMPRDEGEQQAQVKARRLIEMLRMKQEERLRKASPEGEPSMGSQ